MLSRFGVIGSPGLEDILFESKGAAESPDAGTAARSTIGPKQKKNSSDSIPFSVMVYRMSNFNPATLAASAVDRLRREIFDGQLPPGTRLAEAAQAKRLGREPRAGAGGVCRAGAGRAAGVHRHRTHRGETIDHSGFRGTVRHATAARTRRGASRFSAEPKTPAIAGRECFGDPKSENAG